MKKTFVKFTFNNNRFKFEKSNSIEMRHLGLFLTDDVGCYFSSFKSWILDSKFDSTTSNYASLEKESDYIFIGCESDANDPLLIIHKYELLKILDTWEQFCKTKPKEITIMKEDNDTFTIEAKD